MKEKIYKTIKALLLAVHLLAATTCVGQKKMNVLFVISDDLTSTALSCYGNSQSLTPNIDKFAAEGTRYTHAYAQFPVCGPSRASLMFGYYPSATKVYGYTSGREAVGPAKLSWAELFKNNGYYTARVSKIFHMGTQDMMDGKDGTDDPQSWTERFNNQDPQWNAEGEGELVQNNPYGKQPAKQGKNLMSIIKAEGEDADYGDGKTADKVSQLLREHKNKPFFIAAGFIRPHVPFSAPKKYFDAYPYQEITMPPKVTGDWDDIPKSGINYVTTLSGKMSEEQEKKAVAAYYASTAYMDAQFGKILKTLEEEKLEKNTIVIFTSDHGFHLGEHNFWMKVGLHEESAKTPLIIKVPGKKPAVCHSLVELIDLYPTVAALAGLKAPAGIQGKDISETFNDAQAQVREFAFSISDNLKEKGQAYLIRSKSWSFIQYGPDAADGMELYNMDTDPFQYNNLAALPRYQPVLKDMKAKLAQKLSTLHRNDL